MKEKKYDLDYLDAPETFKDWTINSSIVNGWVVEVLRNIEKNGNTELSYEELRELVSVTSGLSEQFSVLVDNYHKKYKFN
jgi:hypothetical protein